MYFENPPLYYQHIPLAKCVSCFVRHCTEGISVRESLFLVGNIKKGFESDGATSILNPNFVAQMWLCRDAFHSGSKSLRRHPESVWVGTWELKLTFHEYSQQWKENHSSRERNGENLIGAERKSPASGFRAVTVAQWDRISQTRDK